MGIGDKLLDDAYQPESIDRLYTNITFYNKTIKCPVKFTLDPLEHIEGHLQYHLRPLQKNMIIDLFKEDSKGYPVNDVLIAIIGMRAGKSAVGSMIMSFLLHKLLAYDDPAAALGQLPHYKLTGIFVANSEEQASKTCYSSFRNILNETPWWQKYIEGYLLEREKTEGKETLFQMYQKKIYFPEKNLEAISITSNSASAAGSTSWGVVFEEIARADLATGITQGETEKRTADAIYDTLSRSAKTLEPFSKIIVTTSPMHENDFSMKLLYQAKEFKCGENKPIMDSLRLKYFPNKTSRMIAYNYSSWEANPRSEENPTGFTRSSFDPEYNRNPTSAARDYGALPPGSVNPYFEYPEKIDNCVDSNKEIVVLFEDKIIEQSAQGPNGYEFRSYVGKEVYPQKHDKMTRYFLCCDQGEVSDSFVVSMGHSEKFEMELPTANGQINRVEKYKVIIDFVEQWIPDKKNRLSVSFQNVEECIILLTQYFNITAVLFDKWQSTEAIERLFSQGIHTEKIGATVEMYDTLKMLIYSDMIILPLDNILITELRQLNRTRSQSGHEKVHHISGGSCDSSDSICRTTYCVYNDSIKNASKGDYILPITQRFSTIRGAGEYFEGLKRDAMNNNVFSPSNATDNIWSSTQGGTFIRPNVVEGIGGKNFFK